jgi:hypothetical protein
LIDSDIIAALFNAMKRVLEEKESIERSKGQNSSNDLNKNIMKEVKKTA